MGIVVITLPYGPQGERPVVVLYGPLNRLTACEWIAWAPARFWSA